MKPSILVVISVLIFSVDAAKDGMILTTAEDTIGFQGTSNIKWAHNCDWIGGDLDHIISSGDRCGPECESHEECTHFSWIKDPEETGTCFFKRDPNSAVKYDQQGYNRMCGYIEGQA